MIEDLSFSSPSGAQADESTGRYIVTFANGKLSEGLAHLKKKAGIGKLPSASDFSDSALDLDQVESSGGAVYPRLGLAVLTLDEGLLNSITETHRGESTILDIEPERMFYCLSGATLDSLYLQGYRDAVGNLYEKRTGTTEEAASQEPVVGYSDDTQSTWGLKAANVGISKWTGRGVKVAVLDTGLDLEHPDFRNRAINSKSFVSGQAVQDGNGHGTHCIGIACGFKDVNGRRYGIAFESTIFAAKVLSNSGSGSTSGILAGMEWAIQNGCQVISMSLGGSGNMGAPSTAYEAAGRRALAAGTLVVAAAGGNGNRSTGAFGFVGQPANCPSIMAVGAMDSQLRLANSSPRSGSFPGSAIDIVAPGVAVYSSVKMAQRYAIFSGSSMAAPHVAGIAAQYAQAFQVRGAQLWQLLSSRARRLPIDSRDVGAGFGNAPE